MNTIVHLWPGATRSSTYAILDTPMRPARFYFGLVLDGAPGMGNGEWVPADNATHRFHRTLTDAIAAAHSGDLDTTTLERQIKGHPIYARTIALKRGCLRITQRLAALRADAGFPEACAVLPELASLVEQAECVLEGKPFDAAGYAGGGGAR